MNGLFKKLEDETFFTEFVTERYTKVPAEITQIVWCKQTIDTARLKFACGEYKKSIEHFALYLESANPDHYKRAGALLHALYKAGVSHLEIMRPAAEAECGFSQEVLDGPAVMLNLGDNRYALSWLNFWKTYHNQALAFDVAYRCCCSYEKNPTKLTLEYSHNVCRYLKAYSDLTMDDCFMLFRSLMLQSQ